jgi:anion-transporting  ArsA/GET3 family ATPase
VEALSGQARASIVSMDDAPATPLLERRLLFVLGKGGVGRTTVAAALGRIGAARGARTIVAEVSARGELPELFGRGAGDGEVELAERLWTIQVDTRRSLDEYLHRYLPLRMLADVVGATRLIGYLAAATPGLRELLNTGKVWELAQTERRVPMTDPYRLVIADAPASGHALGLLSAPGAFARTAGAGPIARQGLRIDEMLHDRSLTGLVGVARAADAAVTELIELRAALREKADLDIDLVIVNYCPPAGVSAVDAQALNAALARGGLPDDARAAIRRALLEERMRHVAFEQIARLEEALPGVPIVELPALYVERVGLTEIDELAGRLGAAL